MAVVEQKIPEIKYRSVNLAQLIDQLKAIKDPSEFLATKPVDVNFEVESKAGWVSQWVQFSKLLDACVPNELSIQDLAKILYVPSQAEIGLSKKQYTEYLKLFNMDPKM